MKPDDLLIHINEIARRQHDADHTLIEILREGAEAEALLDRLPTRRMSELSAELVATMRENHRIHRAQYAARYGVPYTDERGRVHADGAEFREWVQRRKD
jgi:hypothetical protein